MKFTQDKTFPGLLRAIVMTGLMAAGLATLLPGTASAAIDKTLTIQVYQLCDDSGNNCASLGPIGDAYFTTEVNKIWAQAGISVGFNFVQQIKSSAFSSISNVSGDTFFDLAYNYGSPGAFSSTIVDMFLVHTVTGTSGQSAGQGWFGVGGLVIAMDTVMSLGRIDTIAHELGHNFGLVPTSLDGDSGYHSANLDYLMAGIGRHIPATEADIYPSGLGLGYMDLGYDFLPADQIDYARTSSLLRDVTLVPEPDTYELLLIGLIALIMRRRRTAVS